MLGLAEEVRGDDIGIGAFVRDDEDVGRSGEQVDAHFAKQLSLGLCHVSIARPYDHVDRL